jgi:nicotinamidase/pyrazinamidase
MTQIGAGDALIVVDMQKDFLPDGALGVAEGDVIVPIVNACVLQFQARALPIFFSRDWHPADHCSFKAHGGPWPPHCVADTEGASFAAGLTIPWEASIVSKATTRERDAYSAFQDTDLVARLRSLGVNRVFVCGLATDYCVRATAEAALAAGFATHVLTDAVRAVNLQTNDGDAALVALRERGATLESSNQLQ